MIVILTTMKNNIFAFFSLFITLGFIGCTADNFDLAGSCVTCMTNATPSSTIVACANGDGTITLTIDGVEGPTSENDLSTFQVTQEGNQATCQ